MRNLTTILCTVGLSVGLGACQTKDQKSDEKEISPSQASMDQRGSAAQGTSAAIKQFEENKKNYVTKATDDLNRLEAQIAGFKAQAPQNEADRANHDATVQTLEQNLTQARTKLDELKDARAEDWEAKQRDVEQSILTTRAAYDASVARTAH